MSSIPVCFSFDNVTFAYEETGRPVFTDFSLDLPEGVISFVGQNGTGKTTLLLLAGGRLHPRKGKITLFGQDSKTLEDEEERNRVVSFIYQNLEFETEETAGTLLEQIHSSGYLEKKDPDFLHDIIKVFELENLLGKKLQQLSKGGLQRTIMAFSLLYGSKAVMMDEPIFALEDAQKKKVMGYITEYARANHLPLYYSVHELEITTAFSDYSLLLFKDSAYIFGPTSEVCTSENLEKAYSIPGSMMYQKERLHRQHLLEIQQHIMENNAPFN